MKRGRSLVQEENEIFQVGEWLGVIYTVDRSINDPCNAWQLGASVEEAAQSVRHSHSVKP